MKLKLMLPTRILVDDLATKIVCEGRNGYFCLLPRHVDFVSALVPGIFSYWSTEGHEHLIAVDEGTLVKCDDEVLVSVRNAVRGTSLARLRDLAEREFLTRDEHERLAQSALARLEAAALRRMGALES